MKILLYILRIVIAIISDCILSFIACIDERSLSIQDMNTKRSNVFKILVTFSFRYHLKVCTRDRRNYANYTITISSLQDQVFLNVEHL